MGNGKKGYEGLYYSLWNYDIKIDHELLGWAFDSLLKSSWLTP